MRKYRWLRMGAWLTVLLLAVLALLPAGAAGTDTKTISDWWLTAVELKANRTETAPAIDGTADDAVWANAAEFVYDPNDAATKAILEAYGGKKDGWAAGDRVTLRILWDDTALYILDQRKDSFVHYGEKATTGGGSKALPWTTDGAIFGIQPLEALREGDTEYHDIWNFYTTLADAEAQPKGAVQLRVTKPGIGGAEGKKYEALPDGTKVAASLTADGWQMEIAIPWSCIWARYAPFSPAAGYKMGFRISVGNRGADGKTFFGNFTEQAKALGFEHVDYGGFPVLALANADGTVPAYDLTIPSAGSEETDPETDPETAPESKPETKPDTTPDTKPTTGTGAAGNSGKEQKKASPVLPVVLGVVALAAVAGAVIVILRIANKLVRIVAAVLAVAILGGCATGIVLSVRQKPYTPPDESKTDTPTTSGENTDIRIPDSGVPATVNFFGEKVNIMIRAGSFSDEFNAEQTGDLIDNAIFSRNEVVMERLELQLNFHVVQSGNNVEKNYLDTIRNMVRNNMEEYDIITSHGYYGSALAAEGLYYNLNSGDRGNYLTLENPWYNQSFVQECTIAGMVPFVVGDLTVSATDRTVVTFFNQDLLESWDEDFRNGKFDLFEEVLDGNWTLERVQEMISGVYTDMDGQSGRTAGDLYGLVFNNGSMCVDAMLSAVGIRLTERDADGKISLAFGSRSAKDAYSRLYSFMYSGSDGLFLGTPKDGNYYGSKTFYFSDNVFLEKRAMLSFGLLQSAKQFAKDPTLAYGILPLPKLNAAQKNYATTPQDAYSVVSIPRNIGDRLERTTATLELLSWYSYRDVRPVYLDKAYKVRYASSVTTATLFDRILDSVTYDIGALYGGSLENPLHKLRNRIAGYNTEPSDNLNGLWGAYGEQIGTKLEELVATLGGGAAE